MTVLGFVAALVLIRGRSPETEAEAAPSQRRPSCRAPEGYAADCRGAPSSAESSSAAATTAAAASSSRAAKRKAGADTLTAATTRPALSRTGAAAATRPGSNSSRTIA